MHDGERLEAAMLPAMLPRAAPRAAVAALPPVTTVPPPVLSEPAVLAPAPAWTPPPEPPPPPAPPPAPPPPAAPPAIEIQPLWLMEKRLIQAALEHTNQDVSRAVSLLEINPSTIYRKLQAWRAAEKQEA